MIKRDLLKEILNYFNRNEPHNNTLLLSGARQVGKTTLIEEAIKNRDARTVNLYEHASLPEKIDAVESFEELERLLLREINFKPSQGAILVIDEAQEAKKLGRWIRFFKEKWLHQKVVILGSILSNLFEDEAAYPVGRVEEMTLRPFSFKEFLIAVDRPGLREILEEADFENPLAEADRQALIKPYLDYLQTGGMPAVVMHFKNLSQDAAVAWNQLLRQYALDVERHMKDIYKSLFLSAVERIADNTCHPIKMSQIVSTDSPSYRKLPLLLEVMEKWHMTFKIPIRTKQPESSGGMAAKRYLFDVGLANFLLNHSLPVKWQERSSAGNTVYAKLQENFVCTEIAASQPSPLMKLNYYRETKNSREIDFLLPFNRRLIPVEVKSQSSVSRNSLIPMVNFLEEQGLKEGILVYNGPMRKFDHRDKIFFVIPPFLVGALAAKWEFPPTFLQAPPPPGRDVRGGSLP